MTRHPTREELIDTLRRIASEFQALHDDSGKCDSVGEIYHLLRECGAIEEDK
jgi:hypothetical protein